MAYILILQLTLDIILRDHITHYITRNNTSYGFMLRNLGVTHQREYMWFACGKDKKMKKCSDATS